MQMTLVNVAVSNSIPPDNHNYYYYAAAAAAASLSISIKSYPPSFRYKSVSCAASSSSSSKGDSGELKLQQKGKGRGDAEGIEVEIEKLSKNRRRIRSKIGVEASLETVWGILTDYDRLADFIPGLAVSQVLDKRKDFARLLQIGEQNLAFGFKFNAKGIVDCYEKEFQSLPNGQSRDIEFEMIEGDFQLFQGKWSIEQSSDGGQTTLSYTVDVEPKMWLPVQLVEGRLCKEIKMNLFCLGEAAAQKASDSIPSGF